jgi:hypothetical protein
VISRQWIEVRARPTAGTGSMVDGVWVSAGGPEPPLVLDQPCDVQDVATALVRDAATGAPVLTADAKVFLTDASRIGEVEPGMPVTIRWEDGTVQDAEVAGRRRLDGVLLLKFL